ncbi:MAG: phosphoenolpyruvate synthase [Bacilli bacterium]|nr:phosphoenolpyruvate synthase [Bacilli bacterium]
MKYVLSKESREYEKMGGKATALSKIGLVINNIPDWFVVSFEGFDIEKKEIKNDVINEVNKKLEEFSDDTYFAIRSSASNEDSLDNSFAGQFDTFLYISKENVLDKIKEVYLSAFSDRVDAYRKENNISEIYIPSVIVQKMVKSEKSGVAFSANPITSNVKEIVISAVYGLGSGLVDGVATSDTYLISNNNIKKEIMNKDYLHKFEKGEIKLKNVPQKIKKNSVLTDKEILEVKELVKTASDYFERFQDIEWAYEEGKLYLLQSRPITTLANTNNKSGKINVFDNSNIVESYGGITTPLTFSFIRTVYENVYIELCKIFKVKEEKIEMNSQMFKSMLALIDGRVYYNLYGWYGILSMFPGIGKNKKFMESMMGVKESLPDDLFPVPQKTFKDKMALVNTGFGLLNGFLNLKKMTNKFYNRLNDALKEKDIDSMDLYDLHDYYYELERKLLHRWDAPLVNDFLAMIFYGNLKKKCNELFGDEGDLIHNDLLCNEGGIISAEPARRIKDMANMIKGDNELINLLLCDDILYIKKNLSKYPKFNEKLNEYLDKFSDRCLEELKLETKTLKDNPSSLYVSIATFAKRMQKENINEIDTEKNRKKAEKKLNQKLKFKPVQKAEVSFILKWARYTVKNRENLRFERTRLFGRVRELFLRIGMILSSMNVIEEKRDIFYLETDEILYYIDGKSTTNNLKELISMRKIEYEKYKIEKPDERFYSYGAVNIANDFKKESNKTIDINEKNVKELLKGIGASPGIVKGTVRVIKDPVNAKLNQGEILVAEYTDPGWIMLFPAASGILVERGSLLSHSAIVSRELSIPAIVGISGLLNNLKTGDLVEINGTSGIVKKLKGNKE